jgi:hypothetical protein
MQVYKGGEANTNPLEESYGPLNQGDSGQYSAYILKN